MEWHRGTAPASGRREAAAAQTTPDMTVKLGFLQETPRALILRKEGLTCRAFWIASTKNTA